LPLRGGDVPCALPLVERIGEADAGFVLDHLHGHVQRLVGDLGLGLFCQFVDVGDDRDFGVFLFGELDGSQAAVGLEAAELVQCAVVSALGAGEIAADAVEEGRGFGAFRRVGEILK
jgi:hypothetical protein